MKSQSGFTLIEMVAVIIILAIMAATALPKFSNLTGEARLASVQGLAGGLRSAAALAKAKWLAAQSVNQQNVDMGGTNVSVIAVVTAGSTVDNQGYPLNTALGINLALDSFAGYGSSIAADGKVEFWPTGVTTSSSCLVTYQSGTVSATAATVAGCV